MTGGAFAPDERQYRASLHSMSNGLMKFPNALHSFVTSSSFCCIWAGLKCFILIYQSVSIAAQKFATSWYYDCKGSDTT